MIWIKQRILPLVLAGVFSILNAPAIAQDTATENLGSACGTGAVEDAKFYMPIFEGTWSVEHLAGVVMAGTMVLPFPGDGEVENLELKLVGGWLEAHHPEMQGPMTIGFSNEAPFLFAEADIGNGMPAPGVSRESIEAEAGCDIAELPNLIGHAEATVDGITMYFIWRMWPIDANNIVVVQHTSSLVHGMNVISRRSVRMLRM